MSAGIANNLVGMSDNVGLADFLKANTNAPIAGVTQVVNQVVKEIQAPFEAKPVEPVKVETPKIEAPSAEKAPTPVIKKETFRDVVPSFDDGDEKKPVEAKVESVEEEDPELDEKVANFKLVRGKLSETRKTLKQKEEEASEYKKKLELYETGTIVPEVLQEKEQEIARLSKYEKIHNLKSSKEYVERVAKPLEHAEGRLREYAADYDVPKDVMTAAINAGSIKELNSILADNFDDIGAGEVKEIIKNIKQIQKTDFEMSQEPVKYLDTLREENKRVQSVRDAHRRESIANVATHGWTASLNEIKQKGQLHELILKEGDDEHNNTYVRPIQMKASTEYAKIVKGLAAAGLEELPPELSKAIASMTLMAHANAVSVATREAAVKYANEVAEGSKRDARYIRPGSYGSTTSNSAPAATPKTPEKRFESEVDGILSGVLAKK